MVEQEREVERVEWVDVVEQEREEKVEENE